MFIRLILFAYLPLHALSAAISLVPRQFNNTEPTGLPVSSDTGLSERALPGFVGVPLDVKELHNHGAYFNLINY